MKNINIFLFTFNRPDLLQYQIDCLNKYLKDIFNIFIVHDSRDDKYLKKFIEISKNNNLKLFHHKSSADSIKSSSEYHADVVDWVFSSILPSYCDDNDVVLFLDHDMFFIEETKLLEYFEKYDVIGLLQKRGNVDYIWPGIMSFIYSKVKNIDFNFKPQIVDGQLLDTGGGTYKILNEPNISFYDTKVSYPNTYKSYDLMDYQNSNGYEYELHLDDKVLHFRNASNWHNNYILSDKQKTYVLEQILKDFL